MGGSNRLVSDWKEFTDANGWSKRPIRPEGLGGAPVRGEYSIEVGKECILLVTEGSPTSVGLQRLNKSKETLSYYKQGLSVVRKGKYKVVFGLH